jgi:hypothetical protein
LSPATSGTLGSNFNPQNTQCMDACPDFIGVVNPALAGSIFQRSHYEEEKQYK